MTLTAKEKRYLEHDLTEEAAAAAALLEALKIDTDEDDALASDMIEGETSLLETIDRAVLRIFEADALIDGLKAQINHLEARKRRFEARREHLRTALGIAFEVAGLKSVERPGATLSLSKPRAKLGELNEAEIPSQFFKVPEPKLDRTGLLKALKDLGEDESIPGAELVMSAPSITIRTR